MDSYPVQDASTTTSIDQFPRQKLAREVNEDKISQTLDLLNSFSSSEHLKQQKQNVVVF